MQALELVEDRGSKAPFPPSLNLWSAVMKEALARGLMCYPNQGTADGQRGDHVILAPPYIVSEADCDEIVAILADALDAVLPTAVAAARARA